MPANPLQELAEKLAPHFHVDWGTNDVNGTERFTVDVPKITELLTAEFGTLLQAERAATIELCAQIVDEGFEEYWKGDLPLSAVEHGAGRIMRKLAAPEAVSALAAVVQRETEKLRELLQWVRGLARLIYPIYDGPMGKTSGWHCQGCNGTSTGEMSHIEHKSDCKVEAVRLALK